MNNVEIFDTRREFNNRYPSKVFICTYCGKFSTNPHLCTNCGRQANTLFQENYKYIITSESNEVHTIFKPIELEKGQTLC